MYKVNILSIILFYLVPLSVQKCFPNSYERHVCREYDGCHLERFYEIYCYHWDEHTESISSYDNIGKLYISTANLPLVTADLFATNTQHLTDLTLYSDNIHSIEPDSFSELPDLTFLDLSNNNISTVFSLPKGLKYLNLSMNSISTVNSSAFDLVSDLTLILKENKISDASFLNTNCKKLFSLDVSGNSIKNIIFSAECATLTHLNVSRNNLQEFSVNISNVTSLQILDLSYNNLNYISSDTFIHFENLHQLNLSHNPLFKAKDVPINLFQNKHYLEHLILSNTGINNLKLGTFSKLANLSELDLSSNNLYDLQKGIFQGLVSLKDLYLNNNRLTTFDYNAVKSLKSINLNNNLWNCDILSDITNDLIKRNIEIIHGDTYDSEHFYGIHCIVKNKENIKNFVMGNTSDYYNNLEKYLSSFFPNIQNDIENLLDKGSGLYNRLTDLNQNLSESFWEDMSRDYKNALENNQKYDERSHRLFEETFNSTLEVLKFQQRNFEEHINDRKVTSQKNNPTNFDSLEKIQNYLKVISDKISNTTVYFKHRKDENIAEKAEFKSADSENHNNQSSKGILIGIYGILFVLIAKFAFTIFTKYKYYKNYKNNDEDGNPLAVLEV